RLADGVRRLGLPARGDRAPDFATMGAPIVHGVQRMRAIAFIALLISLAAHSQPLPTASPRDAGFSPERLERIDRFFEREIAANRVPGAVVAIARDGKLIYYKAFGSRDPATKAPLPLE